MEKRKGQCEHGQPIEQTRGLFWAFTRLVLHVRLRCGLLSITTPVSPLVLSLMFEGYCTSKGVCQLSIKFV